MKHTTFYFRFLALAIAASFALQTHGMDPNTQLLKAIYDINVDETISALENGANPNVIHDNKPALAIAARNDSIDFVRSDAVQTIYHLSPTQKTDNSAIIELLLAYKANPDSADQPNNSAISAAALYNNTKLIRFLVKHNANVNMPVSFNHTALMCATRWNHSSATRALLKADAYPNMQDAEGETALRLAIKKQPNTMRRKKPINYFIVQSLLDAGADPFIKNNDGKNSLKKLAKLDIKISDRTRALATFRKAHQHNHPLISLLPAKLLHEIDLLI